MNVGGQAPRRRPGAWLLGRGWQRPAFAFIALLAVAAVVRALVASFGAPSAPVQATSTPNPLTARGEVRPISQARVGTLGGGEVAALAVEPGDSIDERQEIARIRGSNGTEVLTSPLRGTVTSLGVHTGDTIMPGTVVATVGDLTRLQVETTNVDEFLIASIHRGQAVSMTVEALDRTKMEGAVRAISLQPQTTSTGDLHYPVVIDLSTPPRDLRPGMTVRVIFVE